MISWLWKPAATAATADLSARVTNLEAQVEFLYTALRAVGVQVPQALPQAPPPVPPVSIPHTPASPSPKVGTSVRKLRTDRDVQVMDRSKRLELQQEHRFLAGHASSPAPSPTAPPSPPTAPQPWRTPPSPSTAATSSAPTSPPPDSPGIIIPKG